MFSRLKFIFRLFVTLILIFVIQKIIFMLVNMGHADGAPFGSCLAVLWHGLRLDVTSACYIIIIPALVMLVSFFFRRFSMRKVLMPYYILASLLMAAVFIADTVLYYFWGAKLDAGELIYADKPKVALAGLEWWAVVTMFVILGLVTWCFTRCLRRVTPVRLKAPRSRWSSLVFIPLAALIFLGMRGSVTQSTANPSFAYFSQYQFCNHSALNPFFNISRSLFKTVDFENEFKIYDRDEVEALVAPNYVFDPSITDTLLRHGSPLRPAKGNVRPDILLIVWEGGNWDMVMNDSVGPNMMRFAAEGVNFTRCYANSFRTDRGIVSLLSGWMGMPTTSLMKMADVCRKLPGIAESLAGEGYATRLIFGGDIDYTNMRGYLLETGFVTVDGSAFFPDTKHASSWGAPDNFTLLPTVLCYPHHPFKQSNIVGRADGAPQAFKHFDVLLTLSSHEPWIVPMQRLADERKNAFAYTDSCIGVLVDSLRAMPEWNNLLIIITPDHGVQMDASQSLADPKLAHIPMVWTGGAVRGHRNIDVIMNQSDMIATLLAQMGVDASDFIFSRNVLSESYASGYQYALHSFKNGCNLIDNAGVTRLDCVDLSTTTIEGSDTIAWTGIKPVPTTRKSFFVKALLQFIYQRTGRL
ncbi:MAG: sulfatase-like hydrolase/transferase [Bacteroidales bacterium]|nr:sulfatase-like hydrolase/transferase [Bacteroidales bacterium]